MPTTEDRLTMLRTRSDAFTGIDFVQVVDACEQTRLRIYFLTDPRELAAPFEDLGDPGVVEPLAPSDLRIYSPRGEAPDVPVVPTAAVPAGMAWVDDVANARRVLEIGVPEPGTFTDYRLRIDDERIDRAFNDVRFSFKAGCDTRLDCAEPLRECVPEGLVDFPVDYLARDFVSLRSALLDFAAQRYPGWKLPREADVGVMLLEVLAAVGDELGYVQERMHRETGFETATERRSLRRKARLVDHEIHDGRMASTLLELTVPTDTTLVEGGWPIWARATGQEPIVFELGEGMRDRGTNFLVDERWNPGAMTPYGFDDADACLRAGATELFVRNDPSDPENPSGVVLTPAAAAAWEGRRLLLRRLPADPSESERLVFVRVVGVDLERDELYDIDVARIRWDAEDALRAPIELERLELSGNIVRATAGASRTAYYRIGPLLPGDAELGVLEAVEREGPLMSSADASLLRRRDACAEDEPAAATRPPIYLLSLPETDATGLAFADPEHDLRRSEPEIEVHEVAGVEGPLGLAWQFRRSLLVDGSDDRSFTLEDGTWRRVVGYPQGGGELVHRDYATSAGYTVRFGDGEFGRLPATGTLFRVDYRLGAGTRANVPAGSVSALALLDVVSPLQSEATAAHNPVAVSDGVDPESIEEIKRTAPYAYAAETFFAVRPEDYGRQAERLGFVQRAHATFRWTGSWLSAITAADPIGAYELSPEHRAELEALLDARRQAGRDVIVVDPKYVDLDLHITLCIARSAFAAHVATAVREALFGRGGAHPRRGFFHPDHFTFGTPLRRSALEAALQRVPGVDAVLGIQIRTVGTTDFTAFADFDLQVADDEVIRVENDPARPERGVVSVFFEGGA